jgi:hypothetical protein
MSAFNSNVEGPIFAVMHHLSDGGEEGYRSPF